MSDTTQIRTNDDFFLALQKLTEQTHLIEAKIEKAPTLEERHPLSHIDMWFILGAIISGLAITHSRVSAELVETLWFVQLAFLLAALIANLSRPRTQTVVHNFRLDNLKMPRKTLKERQLEHGIRPPSNVYKGQFPLETRVTTNAG